MSEHGIAEALGAHIALTSPDAEIWRRVASGEISQDEAESQLSGEVEGIDRAKKIFAPLPSEREQEQLEALLARMDEAETPLAARTSRRWMVGLLAAAAVAALTMGLPALLNDEPKVDSIAFSGGYGIQFDKLPTPKRGAGRESGERPKLLVGGTLSVRLRPEEAVKGPVGVVAFARARSGSAKPLAINPHIAEHGGMAIEAPLRILGLNEGTWELVFAIGLPSMLPTSWDDLDEDSKAYEIIRVEVEISSKL